MWGADLAEAFERDGHVTLKAAFEPAVASRMSQAIWSYVEARTDIRRVDPSTWPPGAPGGVSYKRLKRNASFRAVLESASTRSALDGIFGRGAWEPSRSGAQILFGFPDTAPGDWKVPSRLWHMDAPFFPRVSPPRAIKLFSVVEPLPPCSGATLVLAGTPDLQAAYARDASDEERAGDKQNWHRFLHQTDPWLARFLKADDASDRNTFLTQAHVVDGQPLDLRELGGDPGDVHVCHINLFHSVAPNASLQPRMMVTHAIRPAARTPDGDAATA